MSSLLSSSMSLLTSAIPSSAKALVSPVEGKQPTSPMLISQAALSIPRTLYNRYNGTSTCSDWSLPEELLFNAIHAVAPHTSASSHTARQIIPRLMDLQARLCSEPIERVTATHIDADVKGYWIGKPITPTTDLVVLYLHGGSFVTGHALQSCHALADLLHVMKRENGLTARVFALEYPLAPEAPFPAGLEACVRCVRWMVDMVGCGKVVILGDSAGGNLALTTVLRLRDAFPSAQYLHKIIGVVPISPFVDFLGPRRTPDGGSSPAGSPTDLLPPKVDDRVYGKDEDEDSIFGTTADCLGLSSGRCAVRYYLGTKGYNWHKAEGAWPNPWDKNQWDAGWLKEWDFILGLATKPSSETDLAHHLHSNSHSHSNSPFLTDNQPHRSVSPSWRDARPAALSPVKAVSRGMIRSPSAPLEVSTSLSTSNLTVAVTAFKPPIPRSPVYSTPRRSSTTRDVRRASGEFKLAHTGHGSAGVEEGMDRIDLDGDDNRSETDSDAGMSPGPVHPGGRRLAKRYSFVADRGGHLVNNGANAGGDFFSGVPFPNLASLKSPYYLNPELSNYDLERIYLTLSLSPYVSPYRARTFDNLPPMLFMVAKDELLYPDVIKCVKKAKRTITIAETRLSLAEREQRPAGFGRVDMVERTVGTHVYLLMPESLTGGKGKEGLRDIAGWVESVARERAVGAAGRIANLARSGMEVGGMRESGSVVELDKMGSSSPARGA